MHFLIWSRRLAARACFDDWILHAAILPDGLLAVFFAAAEFCLFSVQCQGTVQRLSYPADVGAISCADCKPAGDGGVFVAVGNHFGQIYCFSLASGCATLERMACISLSGTINALSIDAASGSILAAFGSSCGAWSTTGELLGRRDEAHVGRCWRLLKQGGCLVSYGEDCQIRRYLEGSLACTGALYVPGGDILCAAFAEQRLFVGCRNGAVYEVDFAAAAQQPAICLAEMGGVKNFTQSGSKALGCNRQGEFFNELGAHLFTLPGLFNYSVLAQAGSTLWLGDMDGNVYAKDGAQAMVLLKFHSKVRSIICCTAATYAFAAGSAFYGRAAGGLAEKIDFPPHFCPQTDSVLDVCEAKGAAYFCTRSGKLFCGKEDGWCVSVSKQALTSVVYWGGWLYAACRDGFVYRALPEGRAAERTQLSTAKFGGNGIEKLILFRGGLLFLTFCENSFLLVASPGNACLFRGDCGGAHRLYRLSQCAGALYFGFIRKERVSYFAIGRHPERRQVRTRRPGFGHTKEIRCCAFAPAAGSLLVCGGEDGAVTMRGWPAPEAQELGERHASSIKCLLFLGPDLFVTAGAASECLLWAAGSGRAISAFRYRVPSLRAMAIGFLAGVLFVSFSNGDFVALLLADGQRLVFSHKIETALKNGYVSAICCGDGRIIVGLSNGLVAEVTEAGSVAPLRRMHCLAVSKVICKEKAIWTCSYDGTLRMLGREQPIDREQNGVVDACTAGGLLFVLYSDRILKAFNSANSLVFGTREIWLFDVSSLAVEEQPDGVFRVAIAGANGLQTLSVSAKRRFY